MKKKIGLLLVCAASAISASPYVKKPSVKRSVIKKSSSPLFAHNLKQHAKAAELKYGIPENLLLAIAHYESNESPFAINAKGRGYFFKKKEEAASFVHSLVAEGCRNINVGMMQLHYPSHARRFKSIADMLDPAQNIMYAAKLLIQLKRTHGSWERAVEAYKGNFSETSQNYRARIFSLRFKLPKITLNRSAASSVKTVGVVRLKNLITSTYCVESKNNAVHRGAPLCKTNPYQA